MAKILLVEDIRQQRLHYQAELERDGHCVVAAASVLDALTLVARESPDLAVLDFKMTGIDGLEAALRVLQQDQRIRLIMMSDDASCAADWRCAAADAFVVKSPDTTELRSKIAELLDERYDDVVRPLHSEPPDETR
jgi:CheY-like chemotaxis protein